ncbi:enoyl-CoA hydratase/isomerase family protein [Actinospica robiniae]|uniref:enoyl-CoA hydratase/isomerase family protein n=1 Tax=Actinospica robiniae TaxID=304901 RepID=UPI000427E8C6|nr:enoyl-CoA hydratase/isomerase family protein [Actinospica robiniae]
MAKKGPVVAVEEITPAYWRATFQNPPINLLDPEVYAQLRLLLDRMESDDKLRVVVFDSADPDYYISHLDVPRLPEVPDIPGAADLAEDWPRFVTRLSHANALSIASVRGRTRGIGNEFALACDLRFASREKALFSQAEVGFALVPGGGGCDWLPRLVGRSRALEIMVGGEDFDADTAALYGWINRSIPDADLDRHVDAFARRVAGFDGEALATAKRLVNERVPPPTMGELLQSFSTIAALVGKPAAQTRMKKAVEHGWGKATEWELNHPATLGGITEELAEGASAG